MKLGCIPSRRDPRTLALARYMLHPSRHEAPPQRDWTRAVERFGMFSNDTLSDCTCAAMGHALQAQAANTGRQLAIADQDVADLYKLTGYDPARPETDAGAQLIDVFKLMRGVGLAGNKIGAFVGVDHRDTGQLDAAVNLTGFTIVAAALPLAAQWQTVWDVVDGPEGEPGSWDNHATALLGYDRNHAVLATWGGIKIATVRWCWKHVFEAWAGIDELWLRPDGLTPSGFDSAQLALDLQALAAA